MRALSSGRRWIGASNRGDEMSTHRRVLAAAAGLAMTLAGAGTLVAGMTAAAAATTLCGFQTARVSGGTYIVQNNEWGSGAPECITTDGNADFTVTNSSINNATNGAP